MILMVVFTLCSTTEPDRCETHRVPMIGANELTCLTRAQAEIVPYVRDGLKVTKVGCERDG